MTTFTEVGPAFAAPEFELWEVPGLHIDHGTNVDRGNFSRAWLRKTLPAKVPTHHTSSFLRSKRHYADTHTHLPGTGLEILKKPLSDVHQSGFFTQ